MKRIRDSVSICILVLHWYFAAISFTTCDARKSIPPFRVQRHSRNSLLRSSKNFKALKRFDINPMLDSTNTGPYGVSSPFSLPPYDSLAPIPLPENTPPFCVYPPFTPQTPPAPTTIPAPSGGGSGGSFPTATPPPPPYFFLVPFPFQSPPPSPSESTPTPNPPVNVPSPSPPESVPSPPIYNPNPNPTPSPPMSGTSPPYFEPSPPSYIPSPPSYVPSPRVFQPPVVYPPPTAPPPPPTSQGLALWCVAKPSVPDPIIQEAMNYACGSGADCSSIQPDGPCFQPDTLLAHASFAFNSYWQRTKVAGGTCEFGGTAILVTVDPSKTHVLMGATLFTIDSYDEVEE
ncbi:X8 domain, partial [Dillenia turbinata]